MKNKKNSKFFDLLVKKYPNVPRSVLRCIYDYSYNIKEQLILIYNIYNDSH
jgi:hypothetical protein